MKRITNDLLYLNFIKFIERNKMLRDSLLIALILFASSYAQLAQPKLVLKQNNFDFGDIKQGKTVEHTFVLSNGGEALLKITDVRASCGCTAAVPEKKELKPGESTKLVVKFNSTGRQGKQNKTVSISSNDPQNPKMVITFTGNIIPPKQETVNVPIIYFPETQYDFGIVEEGEKVNYIFKYVNKGSSELIIKGVTSSCDCTTALPGQSILRSLKPGQEGTINVELDAKNQSGKMIILVKVNSNDPKEPTKALTIYADIIKKGT